MNANQEQSKLTQNNTPKANDDVNSSKREIGAQSKGSSLPHNVEKAADKKTTNNVTADKSAEVQSQGVGTSFTERRMKSLKISEDQPYQSQSNNSEGRPQSGSSMNNLDEKRREGRISSHVTILSSSTAFFLLFIIYHRSTD